MSACGHSNLVHFNVALLGRWNCCRTTSEIIAVIAITVLAFIFAPDPIAVPNSPGGSGPIDQFAVSMSLSLTLAYLVTSVGFALTFDLTVDLTAKRMRHAGRLLDSPDQNVGLATQFIVVAIILSSFALRGPPELLIH